MIKMKEMYKKAKLVYISIMIMTMIAFCMGCGSQPETGNDNSSGRIDIQTEKSESDASVKTSTSNDNSSEVVTTTADGARELVSKMVMTKNDSNIYVIEVTSVGKDSLEVTVNGQKLTTSTDYLTVNGSDLKIEKAGNYQISGSIEDGRLIVDADDGGDVYLALSGISIANDDDSAVFLKNADYVSIILTKGSENKFTMTGGKEDEKRDGAIYSKVDFSISGEGSLTVVGDYAHGVVAKDNLAIGGGNLRIDSKKDAIHGDEDILICDGTITITAGDDGIHSEKNLEVNGGKITITNCYEGLEGMNVYVTDGEIDILCTDDGINATDGSSSEPDFGGMNFFRGKNGTDSAENSQRSEMPEGSNGMTPPESFDGMTPPEGFGGMTPPEDSERSGKPNGFDGMTPPEGFNGKNNAKSLNDEKTDSAEKPKEDRNNAPQTAENKTNVNVIISGGKISIVNPTGRDADGIDSNGNIEISGGEVFISLSGSGNNCALDYGSEAGGKCVISGGTVIAAGSSSMQESVTGEGKAGVILVNPNSVTKDNTVVTVTDDNGNVLIETEIPVGFNSIILAAPEIETEKEYTVKINDVEQNVKASQSTGGFGGFGGFGRFGGFGG